MHARIGVLALTLMLLFGGLSALAQEVVLTNGSRLAGTVEKYEGGFAYIRLVTETGKTVLTTMPESAVDKAATEQAQVQARAEPSGARSNDAQTGPFKLPHNDLSNRGPGIAALAAEEKERREEVLDSGAATGRVFRSGPGTTNIPTAWQIDELADLREQPQALPDMEASARVAGLRFYEARLETLASAFARLDDEWEEMWRYCTPITYVGGSAKSSRPHVSYRDAVMDTFRLTPNASRVDDNWSISCKRKDSDFVARGKQVVEAYDSVFAAYADFAQNTGQSAQAAARALPTRSR